MNPDQLAAWAIAALICIGTVFGLVAMVLFFLAEVRTIQRDKESNR